MAKTTKSASAAIRKPTPLNPQQEKFVRLLGTGSMTQQAAYEAAYGAGGKVAEVNAARLLSNARFRSRLAEIQAENAYAAQVTVGYISQELRNVYQLAVADRQYGAATQAMLGLAKLHGMLVDRSEIRAEIVNKPTLDPDAPQEMPLEDWAAKYSGNGAVRH